jgi:hypothetical protein
MVPSVLRIGELATQCGVSIDTIRYYEQSSCGEQHAPLGRRAGMLHV